MRHVWRPEILAALAEAISALPKLDNKALLVLQQE